MGIRSNSNSVLVFLIYQKEPFFPLVERKERVFKRTRMYWKKTTGRFENGGARQDLGESSGSMSVSCVWERRQDPVGVGRMLRFLGPGICKGVNYILRTLLLGILFLRVWRVSEKVTYREDTEKKKKKTKTYHMKRYELTKVVNRI